MSFVVKVAFSHVQIQKESSKLRYENPCFGADTNRPAKLKANIEEKKNVICYLSLKQLTMKMLIYVDILIETFKVIVLLWLPISISYNV